MHRDLVTLCVSRHHSIREAVAQIDRNRLGIVLVTDSHRRLLGTVTDGDVRRAMLDNIMVANTKMYSVPEGSDIEPGDPIYPGRIFLVPPGEQVRQVGMGDIHSSLPNAIQMLMQMSELRSGVNDLRQGDLSSLP